MLEIINCEQNSDEWIEARAGIITASAFKDVLAGGAGKTRRTYMMKLAGEIITGDPTESFSNGYMERGHELEETAIELYSDRFGAVVEKVGFWRNGIYGCSPDGVIGDDGIIEVKTKGAHIQGELLLKGLVPNEHKAQVQGSMFVSGRKWVDFVSYCPKMPMFIKRVKRDEDYIDELKIKLGVFNQELQVVVSQLRGKF